MTLQEVIAFLNKILTAKGAQRHELVLEFQHADLPDSDENIWECVYDLLYEFAYYEPNGNWRKDDSSYFGNDILETKIKATLQKIADLSVSDKP